VHADNDYLDGAIVAFAQDLAEAYHFKYGRPLRVFSDQISILWGEHWRSRIREEIDKTTFLLANVTPRYLASAECREEITRFDAAARGLGEPRLVLPLIWSAIDGLTIVDSEDPVRRLVSSPQAQDVSGLATLEQKSPERKKRLSELADRLHQTIDSLENPAEKKPSDLSDSGDGSPGLVDAIARLESECTEFTESLAATMDLLGQAFSAIGGPGQMTPKLATYRNRLEDPVAKLTKSSKSLTSSWSDVVSGLNGVLHDPTFGPQLSSPDLSGQIFDLAAQLEFQGRDEAVVMLASLGRVSRMLRPAITALEAALRAVEAVRVSALSWAKELSESES
jgi:hypothetical protein